MAGAQAKFGGAARIGKPRSPDLRAIYGRIEAEALDLGKGGKIARSRPEPMEMRSGQGGGSRPPALNLSVRQRVNAARRLPPAIVKVIRKGQTGGKADLRNQLNYLTRNGELSLTRADGSVIDSVETMADAMRTWQVDFDATTWKHKTTHLLVSSPQGTDPEVVWRAADRFAKAMFEGGARSAGQGGETWDYVKIAHNDTDYPHVHFVVNNLGLETGEQFKVWPTHRINPQLLRTTWAEAARAEGLELDDTPRRARGLPPSREKTPDRQRAEEGEVSTYYLNRAAREIVAASEGRETGKARRFRSAFGEILEAERGAYREVADSLRAGAALMGSDALRRDAEIVDAFTDDMKMPQTDGDLIIAHLRHLAKKPKGTPEVSGIDAFREAALTMVQDGNEKGWRIMSETERAERYSDENIAEAVRKRFEYTEQLFKLENDPAKRADLQARLGQEKVRLAALAERPEWATGDAAKEADRPVTESRRALLAAGAGREASASDSTEPRSADTRLAVAASDASEQRIMADADRAAMRAFELAGVDPEAALHRVRYEGPVDRATARQWRAEEVSESAQARSTSEADAVQAVERAHEVAFAAYDHAAKRLRQAAPTDVPGNGEDARAVLNEQADMQRKADEADETAKRNRKMKR